MNDHFMLAAADCFADQAMIVAFAVAGRCVEKIDPEIERAANSGDRLRVVCRPIGSRHAVTAEANDRYHKISIAESAVFHSRAATPSDILSQLLPYGPKSGSGAPSSWPRAGLVGGGLVG